MGTVSYNTPKRYHRTVASEYADYYESEEDTFRTMWKRLTTLVASRYKLFIDKNSRQQHGAAGARNKFKEVGIRGYDLIRPEVYYVTKLLKPKEKIVAAVCGRVESGSSVFLVLTDSRLLYLDIIPLFTTVEEISFGTIEAVSLGIGQFDATVSLYTAVGTFTLRSVGLDAASRFVSEVDALIEKNQLVMASR